MRIAHELDAGAWCRQSSCEIGHKTAIELTTEFAHLGARELSCALADCSGSVYNEQSLQRWPRLRQK